VTETSCDSIALLRRKLQRISNNKIIFIDETHVRFSDAPNTTLVAPGEKQFVVASDTSHYAARYDMIAGVIGDRVLPPIIFSPNDRKGLGVHGITEQMLIDYIEDILARTVSALDRYPVFLVCDRASIHTPTKIREAFWNVGCEELVEVLYMPTNAAKKMSPLDNSLFHEWKERVRNHAPYTEKNIISAMIKEWEATTQKHIKQYFHHCGITYGCDPYTDCPLPNKHTHTQQRQSKSNLM
jgi:hypothetical protein